MDNSRHINGMGPSAGWYAAITRKQAPRGMGPCPDCKREILSGERIAQVPTSEGLVTVHEKCFDRKGVECTSQSLPF